MRLNSRRFFSKALVTFNQISIYFYFVKQIFVLPKICASFIVFADLFVSLWLDQRFCAQHKRWSFNWEQTSWCLAALFEVLVGLTCWCVKPTNWFKIPALRIIIANFSWRRAKYQFLFAQLSVELYKALAKYKTWIYVLTEICL